MNEVIYQLVDAIKEDQRYLDFIEASKTLKIQTVQDLLSEYQSALSELNDLKQFDAYIDLTEQKEKLKEVKRKIGNNEIIQLYYEKYYAVNELLDHVTKLVFQNISDSLDMTGIQL